jgi:NAD(P)-dependent dehydrogenase (short-subunit alcohol dehydrogenase family)
LLIENWKISSLQYIDGAAKVVAWPRPAGVQKETSMDFQLTDRVVVITGAGSGIGLATAKSFLAEGAKVVAADLDPSAVGELSDSVAALAVDLSTPDGPGFVIAETMSMHGRVDALVNNVGAFPFRESFLAVSDAEWHELMNLNFYSAVRACRAALPHMVEQGRGAIVSVASDVGRAPDRFFVDYSISKAAVLMMSKALSIEFGPAGVRSNCVSPGPTRTPAWDRPGGFGDSLAAEYGLDKEAAIDHFAKEVRKLPLQKVGDPADVARVIAFLASDVSKHVTGADYTVDGGVVAAA